MLTDQTNLNDDPDYDEPDGEELHIPEDLYKIWYIAGWHAREKNPRTLPYNGSATPGPYEIGFEDGRVAWEKENGRKLRAKEVSNIRLKKGKQQDRSR